MIYSMNKPMQIGQVKFAVVSTTRISSHTVAGSCNFICQKQPAFVLVLESGQIQGSNILGEPVPLSEILTVCPEAAGEFSNARLAAHGR